TTIAVPVATAGGGRNTVTDGSLTFAIVRSPEGDVVTVSGIVQDSEPGAFPGHSLISAGVWAAASVAIAKTAATSRRRRRLATALPHSLLLDGPDRLRAEPAIGPDEPLR